MTQLRLTGVKPRSAWIVGRATVTIVPSRMVMSDAVHKITSARTRERVMRPSKVKRSPWRDHSGLSIFRQSLYGRSAGDSRPSHGAVRLGRLGEQAGHQAGQGTGEGPALIVWQRVQDFPVDPVGDLM